MEKEIDSNKILRGQDSEFLQITINKSSMKSFSSANIPMTQSKVD